MGLLLPSVGCREPPAYAAQSCTRRVSKEEQSEYKSERGKKLARADAAVIDKVMASKRGASGRKPHFRHRLLTCEETYVAMPFLRFLGVTAVTTRPQSFCGRGAISKASADRGYLHASSSIHCMTNSLRSGLVTGAGRRPAISAMRCASRLHA